MTRRLVQLTVLSLAVTVALVASVPEKRTATIRLEIWMLAVLGAALLVHLMRTRLPLTADPLARRPKPEAEVDDPLAVESLAGRVRARAVDPGANPAECPHPAAGCAPHRRSADRSAG